MVNDDPLSCTRGTKGEHPQEVTRVTRKEAGHGADGPFPVQPGEPSLAVQHEGLLALARRCGLQDADAADVVQQAELEMWQTRNAEPEQGMTVRNWLAWEKCVVKRRAANVFRRRKQQRAAPLDEVLGTDPEPLDRADGPGTGVERGEEDEQVRKVLETLHGQGDDLNLRLFEMRHVEGLRPAEIARMLDLPAAEVSERLRQAKKALRKALGNGPWREG